MFNSKLLVSAMLAMATLTSTMHVMALDSGKVDICGELNLTQTEAGNINFNLFSLLDNSHHTYQKIAGYSEDSQCIVLGNGSRWQVSNFDSIKGWDKFNRIVITQNHAVFSTYKYALVNLEIGAAVPISLVTPPVPNSDEILFVQSVDHERKLISLNNGQVWDVKEHYAINKFTINTMVVLGLNSGDYDMEYPYLIIDASLNSTGCLRARALTTLK